MAKHDTDPVLAQLVGAVNESRQAGVPVTVSAHGRVLSGVLIAEETYFTELVQRSPLMSALQPASGQLGKEYVKAVKDESGHHLHLRGGDAVGDDLGLWRVSLEAVDAWSLRSGDLAGSADDKGPFARLFGAQPARLSRSAHDRCERTAEAGEARHDPRDVVVDHAALETPDDGGKPRAWLVAAAQQRQPAPVQRH